MAHANRDVLAECLQVHRELRVLEADVHAWLARLIGPEALKAAS